MPSTNKLNIAAYLASESIQQKNKSQLANTDFSIPLSICSLITFGVRSTKLMHYFCRLYISSLLPVQIFKLSYTFPLHSQPSQPPFRNVRKVCLPLKSQPAETDRRPPRMRLHFLYLSPSIWLSRMPPIQSQRQLLSLPLNMPLVLLQTITLLTMKTIFTS